MHNTNEHKSFDELFSDSAEMQQFPVDKDAWLEMEARLDDRDRRRRWTTLLWLSMVGVILLGGLWTLRSNTWDNTMSDVTAKTENNVAVNATTEKVKTDAKTKPAIKEVDKGKTGTLKADKTPQFSARSSAVVDTKRRTTSKRSITKRDVLNQAETVNESNTPDIRSVSTSSEAIRDTKEKTVQLADSQLVQDVKMAREVITLAPITDIYAQVASLHRTSEINPASAAQTVVTPGKYAFGVHLAPEWSSVGLLSDKTLAWRVGGDVSYSINPRWEVSLGLGYSKKLYKGQGEDYVNAAGWVDDVSPESMKAKCYVIDVPVMARRYFGDNRSNGFYVELGVSNYILDTEWYGFEYKEEDKMMLFQRGVTPLDEITIKQSSNNHWVGVGQFAVGYRQKVKDKYYIDIAPYVSVPFTGIGEGKVKLYSTGIRFSARFTQ